MAEGPYEIPQLTIVLQDQAKDQSIRDSAASSLVQIAQGNPDYRGQCVAILTATLERYQRNPIELNTSLIAHLIELKARESAAMVQQVIKAGEYERERLGDWGRVSRELGVVEIKPAAARPPRAPIADTSSLPSASNKPPEFFSPNPNPPATAATIAAGPHLTPKQRDKLREKRKQERKAKKQNRRR